MTRLKFYDKENMMLKELGFFPREIRINKSQTLMICRKLSKHFKFSLPEISFYGNLDSGSYHQGFNKWIRFNNNPSYQVVIHELAHHYNQEQFDNCKHTKKLMKTIKRFAKYVMKKNYWISTLEK